MNKLDITGSTPLNCTGLKVGDYYVIIHQGKMIGQLLDATILNIKFRIFIKDDELVDFELTIPTIDLIDDELELTHVGDSCSINLAVALMKDEDF